MLAVSPGFLAALAAPQRVTCRVQADKGGTRLHNNVPVLGGYVEVDAGSITRRRLTLEVAPQMNTFTYEDRPAMPSAATDPLAPYGQELTVEWGLTYIGGVTEWLPLGVFRIDDVRGSLLNDSAVTITGVSREAHVADDRFGAPYTASSPSAQSLITQLIHDTLPTAEVISQASMDRRVPTTTWDEDRWGAITDLAESIAAVVYCDPRGRFVIADAPTTSTAPVWQVSAGAGGVLVSADSSASRSKVYNRVVVRGESPSSDAPPVRGEALDLDPTSPTRWGDPLGGSWGKRTRFMYLPTVTDSAQAAGIARANLFRFIGSASTMDVRSIPNAALEALDVVDVITDASDPGGTVRRHAVDKFRVPLAAGGSFPMSTRDLREVAA